MKAIFMRLTLLIFFSTLVFAQVAPEIGIRDRTPHYYALTQATVIPNSETIWENGTILIKDGIIIQAGPDLKIPDDARIIEMKGRFIYPGFIELYMPLDLPEKSPGSVSASWNSAIHPEYKCGDVKPDKKTIEDLQSLGFTAALAMPEKGIFRGSSRLIGLDKWEADVLLESKVIQNVAFDFKGEDEDKYPSSLLGSIALVRQTFYDADWYGAAWNVFREFPGDNIQPEFDDALEVLANHRTSNQPFCFTTKEETGALRVIRIADEFALDYWLLGSGYEYRRKAEIAAQNPFIILPLNFPSAPDVSTQAKSLDISLEDLRHWDMAPDNPAMLEKQGIRFSLTTNGLKDRSSFRDQLVRSVNRGFSKKSALAALTSIPARELGLSNQLGSIEAGKRAFLTVVEGDYFNPDNQVISLWVDGEEVVLVNTPLTDVRGTWITPADEFELNFSGSIDKIKGELILGDDSITVKKLEISDLQITFMFSIEENPIFEPANYQFSGTLDPEVIHGFVTAPDGSVKQLDFEFFSGPEPKTEENLTVTASELVVRYPEGAYGFEAPPEKPDAVLIKNATIWTCEEEGILENADLLIQDGKIKQIGRDLDFPRGAVVINASGKHVTPGIVDPHSHTAASSINEGAQAISSEVRIQDVLDPDDISMYRQLAGGVTTIHPLHGSANPIGGQDVVIKLRWGLNSDGILMKEAPAGIKFALGENVKQSNWGEKYTSRYPQTRMGVDQIIRDAFNAAGEYDQEWQDYHALKKSAMKKTIPPRRDLELEPLAEVLRGERIIHCHAYRQDEMLNIIRIADDYGITIATFDHGLEGYKIASEIVEHGVGVTAFSDWWAYKFEVYDAIPYNGAMLYQTGASISYNSDSDELARRLNTEAAKAVKYGGVPPEEALKFVTLNPAEQLKVDQYIGSLKKGKHADIAIWSGSPLSVYSRCEQTWIEGRKYFDLLEDERLHQRDLNERTMLIQKILSEESGGNNSSDQEGGWK